MKKFLLLVAFAKTEAEDNMPIYASPPPPLLKGKTVEICYFGFDYVSALEDYCFLWYKRFI